ncbi:hypothetical protein CTEN210_03315 [Chaetoceros tenuissimus]|uniref:Calmodulin-lysine N-methyltransferase n=1 Tax=Chaetoceros tenuissimus TaxID=426638 RepID=A0AAD3CJ54_9STRA|nr:hypothetical protein CTEN210_03315 [Chaetoceros tenuissimus]
MQNRISIRGIPSCVPKLENGSTAIQELVESHGCWLDRFGFIEESLIANEKDSNVSAKPKSIKMRRRRRREDKTKSQENICAVAEFYVENIRNQAMKSLHGFMVYMDADGNILHSHACGQDSIPPNSEEHVHVSFQIEASAATPQESKIFLSKYEKISIGNDESGNHSKRNVVEIQRLSLTSDIHLIVKNSENGGGTGESPWKGGLILAKLIAHWMDDASLKETICPEQESIISCSGLFTGKVVELGAGSAGLPSMALAKFCKLNDIDLDIQATDGVDEIVVALQTNIALNGFDDEISVKHLDWNSMPEYDDEMMVDTIIFADCVYNDAGANALVNAISHILKKGGQILGVLPDFRVGLDLFEQLMIENQFEPTEIPIIDHNIDEGQTFKCSGGSGKNYRLLHWACKR